MLLELVMIVKNSGEVLRKCLRGIKPYIDYWTILDTGSVDNTMDIIREEMKDIKGNLYQESFIDFSTTRNRSLELSSGKCKYIIILDDSYELRGGDNLRSFLSNKKNNNSSYSIKIGKLNDSVLGSYYYSLRIIKSDKNLRYRSRVHEYIDDLNTLYLNHINGCDDIFINDLDDNDHLVRSRNRFKRDIKFLLEEDRENPNNPRTLMYLGTTYSLLKKYDKAIEYYKKMQELGRSSFNNINSEYEFIAYYEEACLDFSEISKDGGDFRRKMISLQKKFPNRAEPYYKLCVFLYENANTITKNYDSIIKIIDKLVNIPKPELYVTILDSTIYDYYIPYMYIDINLKAGNFDKAIKELRRMLDLYPYDQPLLNIKYSVCDNSMYSIESLSPGRTLVIHTGQISWVWDPNNNTKISGSEYMAMNIAKEFVNLKYRVFIFGSFESEEEGLDYQGMYDGIQYIDHKFFPEFSSKYVIDYLIISRFVKNLVYYDNIHNVYLWVHDVLPQMSNNSLVCQTHLKKFKGFITLSNWQKKYVMDRIGVPENMMILSRNAIYNEKFLNYDINKKIPYRFIYASDPNRGLDYLIDMIPQIKDKYPETTLVIYTRTEHIDENVLEKINSLDYVTLNYRVSQDRIKEEYLKSDVWLYPTNFEETYCITAVEAMASGCLVACTSFAGLADTVGDRGITCKSPIAEEKNRKDLLNKLFFVLDRPEIKKRYIDKAREWALKQTYSDLAVEWIRMFKNV